MKHNNLRFTVGVIGHTGMVGSQVYNYFKKKYKTTGIAKFKSGKINGSWEQLNKCTVVFVCVPTPFNFKRNRADFGLIDEVLGKIEGKKIVVIKSTIWPGTTEQLQSKFPLLELIFNPEFLSRISAKRDFEKPDRQLVGYSKRSKSVAKLIMKLLPKAKYSRIMKATEAELIKYSHNVHGAMRIIYANHIYDVCQKLQIDYDEVKNGFAASEYIGVGMLRYMNIFHNKKRGYGGPCFPKDVNAYIEFCNKIGVGAEIIKGTRSANRRILAEQGLSEEKVEIL